MNASVSRASAILTALFSVFATSAWAQDAVVQKDGQRREGQILGIRADTLRIKVGPVETTIPMTNVASVTMAPPQAFNDSLASWQKGDAAKTLSTLKPLVETFMGLPTNWAERATALLGEVYLASGQTAEAETIYKNFQKFYPNAGIFADVGLAHLAIEKKEFGVAREKLAPIVEAAKSKKLPESGESAVYGQALYLMGQVQEASAENAQALENYLLVVTLFHEDKAVVAKAEERANVLKQNKVIVP